MPTVGLFVPTAAPDARADTPLAFGQRAEAAGVHSLWLPERPVFPSLEPLMVLGALAATTTRPLLGTCVLLGTLRPPVLLAKMAATIDVLAAGRLVLGLGVGSRADDFAAAEVPMAGRGPRAAELIEILRLAWSGAPLRYDGRYYHLDVGPVGPRPARAGGPPIWLGGNSEPALRRAGRMADGHIATSTSGPDGIRRTTRLVRESAEAAGRDPAAVTIAALVRASIDEDRDRAVERAIANAEYYRPGAPGNADMSSVLLGTPDACVRAAHAYFDAGVDLLIVAPVTADLAHLDRLLGEVFAHL
jgi:probable F420-dependent oxidoreductase